MKKEKKELTLEEKVIKRKKIGSLSLLIILLFSLVAVSYSLGWSKGRKSVKNDNLEVSEPLHLYDYYNKVDVNNDYEYQKIVPFDVHWAGFQINSNIYDASVNFIGCECQGNIYYKYDLDHYYLEKFVINFRIGCNWDDFTTIDFSAWMSRTYNVQQSIYSTDEDGGIIKNVVLNINFFTDSTQGIGINQFNNSTYEIIFANSSSGLQYKYSLPTPNIPFDVNLSTIDDEYAFILLNENQDVSFYLSEFTDNPESLAESYENGYNDGYNRGYSVGSSSESLSIGNIMNSIFRAPYTMFHDAFDFELPLGNGQTLDVGGIMMFLLTIGICLAIVALIGRFK